MAQEIRGFYGPLQGFNATQPFYRLLLYEENFFLFRSIYNEDKANFMTLSGEYEIRGDTLLLRAMVEETDQLSGFMPGPVERKDISEIYTAAVSVNKAENLIFISLVAFDTEIIIKKYISPPGPFYKTLADQFNDNDPDDLYNSFTLFLSGPECSEYDYGDFFSINISYFAQCNAGDSDTSSTWMGAYEIKDDKLYLFTSYIEKTEGFDKRQLTIQAPETMVIDIHRNEGQLSFSIFGHQFSRMERE